jgi:hypothetical protein
MTAGSLRGHPPRLDRAVEAVIPGKYRHEFLADPEDRLQDPWRDKRLQVFLTEFPIDRDRVQLV